MPTSGSTAVPPPPPSSGDPREVAASLPVDLQKELAQLHDVSRDVAETLLQGFKSKYQDQLIENGIVAPVGDISGRSLVRLTGFGERVIDYVSEGQRSAPPLTEDRRKELDEQLDTYLERYLG
jgi:hypothetical protein